MELRQIEHVVAVVDQGGFTAAADEVGITQPALSQSVAALERELGTPLFVRGRRVAPTAAGEAFLGPARQALRAVAAARDATEEVTGLRAGRLDLVALATLAVDPLSELVGRLRRDHPGIVVRVAAPDHRADVIDQVRRGDAELGLDDVGGDVTGLVARPVTRQEVVLTAPPGTRLGARVARRRLGSLDLVSAPPGTATRALLDQVCGEVGVTPRVVVETAHREALAALVVAGAGAALLPAPLARQAAAGGAVVAALDPPLRREVGLLSRPGPLSPAAAAFVALAGAGAPG